MALYLDIDLDYFVSPIIKESITNLRPSDNTHCLINEPINLINILKHRGVLPGLKRYLFTNHMQSHLRWWLNRKNDNTVIHIDAHSDLYGHSHPDLTNLKMLGCQNYLWHSIREGLVSEIYWVLPDNTLDITNPEILNTMFSPAQLGECYFKDNVLHAELLCILPDGRQKTIPYHLMHAQHLPVFQETAEVITIATSPEFIPRQADHLINSVGQPLGIAEDVINNVLRQHQEMKCCE